MVSNATSQVNYSKLGKKLAVDAKMIKAYIGYFEDNFLIRTLSNYHHKLTEQIKSTKKLYVSDNGFLNLGVKRSQERGMVLENMVFTALNREGLSYLLDNKECDFYLNTVLYQVSYDSEDTQTRSREFEGLKYFLEKLKKEKAYLVTYDRDEVAECKDTEIEVMRVDRFLLNLSTVIHSENIK